MIEELREDPAPFKKLKEMLDLEGVIVYTQLDGYRCFLPQNKKNGVIKFRGVFRILSRGGLKYVARMAKIFLG